MVFCPICGASHERSHRYCVGCHARYMRKWRRTHPLNPEQQRKANARSYANSYKRRGKLIQEPCKTCGNPDSQMHHDNYDRPLEVSWLCRACRLKLHVDSA